MTPILAYRRQPFLREICEHVGYQGRYVWLIPAYRVTLHAVQLRGASRLRFKLLEYPKIVRRRLVSQERRLIKLTVNDVLLALPYVEDRRWTLLVFAHPHTVGSQFWSQIHEDRLKPHEAAIVEGDMTKYDERTTRVVRAICIYRQLITQAGTTTPLGQKCLKAYYRDRHVAGESRRLGTVHFKS